MEAAELDSVFKSDPTVTFQFQRLMAFGRERFQEPHSLREREFMSISDAVIARGDLIVATEANSFPFRFDVRRVGFVPAATQPISHSVAERSTTTTIRPGSHLVLAGLPASPVDAFRSLALSYTPDAFTLTVVNAAAFSPRLNFQLEKVHLDFSFHMGARRLQVAGGRNAGAVQSGDSILTAQLTDSSRPGFSGPIPQQPSPY